MKLSNEAVALYRSSDIVDLHVDTFIWTRIFGYDLLRRHGRGLLGARFYGQADLPRLREAGVGSAIWSITTNPFRRASRRAAVFAKNLDRLLAIFARAPDEVAVCRSAAEHRAARAAGRHAAFIGVQGGNAFDGDLALATFDASVLIKVTLVHLSTSSLGTTSAPTLGIGAGNGDGELTGRGVELVRALNRHRIFVDLAHINRQGFFDAVAAHDKSQPLLVSHTGIAGVTKHWRNVDDEQLRVVADTGGVIGVMYQSSFLGESNWSGRAEAIVTHLQHIIDVVGEDHAALGSDWDGAIITPRDMQTCLELPLLVELMLQRGWSADRVRKILGGNFLRALALLRP
ncbi:MAG TPA: membrane dipeptidase [Polyangia bacterium]|jgi:membrane dipeptidase